MMAKLVIKNGSKRAVPAALGSVGANRAKVENFGRAHN
jgi:hypothetical protein